MRQLVQLGFWIDWTKWFGGEREESNLFHSYISLTLEVIENASMFDLANGKGKDKEEIATAYELPW